MKIGFIGAGVVAQTIAKHVLPFGHEVILSNSRGPDSLVSLVKELGSSSSAPGREQNPRRGVRRWGPTGC
jgi:predicted dinucleotide-binding enzyme